jgi:hypothetical protein
MMNSKKLFVAALIGAAFTLSACSADRAIDNTVNGTGFVVKTAAKGAVGAGKLAYKGVKKVASADSN